MSTLDIAGIHKAERFVKQQQSLGNDVRWDNYDMVFFRPDPRGWFTPDGGAFRHGTWGFENRVVVDREGTWKIDYKNVRRPKRRTRGRG